MKKLGLLFLLLSFGVSSFAQKSSVTILAKDKIELDYPEMGEVNVAIKNKSSRGMTVQVLDKSTNKQVSGFGLGPLGKADVIVIENGLLVIKNDTKDDVSLALEISKVKPKKKKEETAQYISFTFKNTSIKPVPLLIPSVMNPNLSPLSNSGVRLKIGQEVLFKSRGKKYVLLTVDDSYEQGTVLDIPKLLKARKKELGI